MKTKGLSRIVVNMLVFLFFAAFSIGIIYLGFSAHIKIENVIGENELLNRKLIFGKVLLSSDKLVYSDVSGIHKGVVSEEDLNQLDTTGLFSIFSYKPDAISSKGYLHYVRVDVVNEQTSKMETAKEFLESPMSKNPIDQYVFTKGGIVPIPINYIDTQGNVRLGKMFVNIIPL